MHVNSRGSLLCNNLSIKDTNVTRVISPQRLARVLTAPTIEEALSVGPFDYFFRSTKYKEDRIRTVNMIWERFSRNSEIPSIFYQPYIDIATLISRIEILKQNGFLQNDDIHITQKNDTITIIRAHDNKRILSIRFKNSTADFVVHHKLQDEILHSVYDSHNTPESTMAEFKKILTNYSGIAVEATTIENYNSQENLMPHYTDAQIITSPKDETDAQLISILPNILSPQGIDEQLNLLTINETLTKRQDQVLSKKKIYQEINTPTGFTIIQIPTSRVTTTIDGCHLVNKFGANKLIKNSIIPNTGRFDDNLFLISPQTSSIYDMIIYNPADFDKILSSIVKAMINILNFLALNNLRFVINNLNQIRCIKTQEGEYVTYFNSWGQFSNSDEFINYGGHFQKHGLFETKQNKMTTNVVDWCYLLAPLINESTMQPNMITDEATISRAYNITNMLYILWFLLWQRNHSINNKTLEQNIQDFEKTEKPNPHKFIRLLQEVSSANFITQDTWVNQEIEAIKYLISIVNFDDNEEKLLQNMYLAERFLSRL